jgi:hypothetical protein
VGTSEVSGNGEGDDCGETKGRDAKEYGNDAGELPTSSVVGSKLGVAVNAKHINALDVVIGVGRRDKGHGEAESLVYRSTLQVRLFG